MAGEGRGFAGKFLRVDLTTGQTSDVVFDEKTLRQWVGGVGLGAKILYEEVPPGVAWDSPDNRLIIACGPLGGTRMPGSGTFTVVTKGPLTGGATATQANGYLGAYMKFSGYDGIILQGQAPEWKYLYMHDGTAELRSAGHLVGQDVYDTDSALKKEIGGSPRNLSIFSVGPAGENLIKFAGILGDHGHAAAHNGSGAVMASKRLKSIVAARGKGQLEVANRSATSKAALIMNDKVRDDPDGTRTYHWGTSTLFTGAEAGGWLPIKNYTTSLFPEAPEFMGDKFRSKWEMKPEPCWACRTHHCHTMRITDGPFAGQSFEEPEYEAWAAFGPLIGNTEVGAAAWLTDLNERLGFDVNEMGFLAALIIEWYERGVITKQDTGGLELNWGNYRALAEMMKKIALRDGPLADILAEGIKHASKTVAGGQADWGVYIEKGHGPRGHDHRARWSEILDYATSSAGTIETGPISKPEELGLPSQKDPFSPDEVPLMLAKTKGRRLFFDSTGACLFTLRTDFQPTIDIVNAVTGWDMTIAEAVDVGDRAAQLLRAFNLRHGVPLDVERPSPRYGSTPVDGPVAGVSIQPQWDKMMDTYYNLMGWDRASGRPLPETLRRYGLDSVVADLWEEEPARR